MINSKHVGLFLDPIPYILIHVFFELEGLYDDANGLFASTAWIAIWWITEVIPIAATTLLPIVLFPLSGNLDNNKLQSALFHYRKCFFF